MDADETDVCGSSAPIRLIRVHPCSNLIGLNLAQAVHKLMSPSQKQIIMSNSRISGESTRRIRVLIAAPSLDLNGGQAQLAVRLIDKLKQESSLDVAFIPH